MGKLAASPSGLIFSSGSHRGPGRALQWDMRDSGVSCAVSQCIGAILERRGASGLANNIKCASRNDVVGANSPVGGLSKRSRRSCLGHCHHADRANVPTRREVHGRVEFFHSDTQRPNVETRRPALPFVWLISPVIVPRYALGCPATALCSEEMPVNSRKSCCLPSNLQEGDTFQHEVHGMSPRPVLPREFENITSSCLTYCLNR